MNIAIVFAGGIGTRMHTKDIPKQFLKLSGKSIIIHTLEVFDSCDDIDAIVVACVKEWIPYLKEEILANDIKKVASIVPGGETGQDSIYNGLLAAKNLNDDAIVLIHDGVRPMITKELLKANIDSVKKYGSSISATSVKETVIITSNDSDEVVEIPERSVSKIAKAPQSFYLRDILNVHEQAIKENKHNFIDSCGIMKHYGYKLHTVDCPDTNIKITTQSDYYAMRTILQMKEDMQLFNEDGKE